MHGQLIKFLFDYNEEGGIDNVLCINKNRSFSVVDDREFCQFVKSLNPLYEFPNCQTIFRYLI
jgi:hypothetical protein